MFRTRRLLVLATLILGVLAPSSASAAGKPPSKTEMSKLTRAVAKAPLSRSARRAATRDARSAASLVRRKKTCPASTKLISIHSRLTRAKARGRKRSALLKVALRVSKVRGKLLRSLADGKGCGGAATFDVDRTVKPAQTSLPGFAQGTARPLARVVDADGDAADFVANELWFIGSLADAQALARRWKGTVIKTIDSPVEGVPTQHLLRVNPSAAANTRLAGDVGKLVKTRGTAQRVSSELGLDLMTAAAREARRNKNSVGINWVGGAGDIAGGGTTEAADGPVNFNKNGNTWSRNAFDWKHLAAGTAQDMGVTEAWQLLARAHRLQRNSVKLAVLDMGFAPETNGPDFGSDWLAISNVPFTNAIGTANLSGCSGGNPCPWHGTNVLNAAAGVPDNGVGAAGPGGPVSQPVVVFTLYDFFTGIAAVGEAFAAGARIANMSYSAAVPAILSWSVIPFELTTASFRAAGMVMFASSGNAGENVDAEDCFIVCWEETLHTPCENIGVECVGALGHDTMARADYSNYGSEGVDFYAPGTVLVGSDPRTGGVHAVNGTSFSSPYTAGVAALLKAASPGISAGDLVAALNRTLRPGSTGVRKVISPLAAVRDVLPALIVIDSPTDGLTAQRGTSILFEAFAYDDGRGTPTIDWTVDGSSIGGGTGFRRQDLGYGSHEVRATARFPDGSTVTDTARVTLQNTAPTIAITSPASGSSFYQSQQITFRAESTDINQPESNHNLRNEEVTWFVDGSATPWGTGHSPTRSFNDLSLGSHTIRVRGTDEQGATAEATITITVTADPADLPPNFQITGENCADPCYHGNELDNGNYYKDVTFTADAADPEGQPLTYRWYKSTNGGAFELIPGVTTQDPTIRLHYVGPCNATQYVIRGQALDPAENIGQDDYAIAIATVC